ncbi:hypothetical protein GUITHDRAFT_149005 [Guillardia theta CCMP2712]|uniref:Uncharacterized protein n=1 Tax=Guillardia theta (strain CCMP2712) TaxID=905079 RepID=L1I7Q1_GUITC|nr:hypothetical protein GUITHDRAFT_149005 [Guillardia theta CCMP2712]EKX31880.1 hypothetical protein GUITHDRAFT_149005 [Guillardia theta CCMP2712]|eukprot:XP_005818860.1 hypothetical protein GUITHDRAFT_149005 [Guillardia theta CCMP2712]
MLPTPTAEVSAQPPPVSDFLPSPPSPPIHHLRDSPRKRLLSFSSVMQRLLSQKIITYISVDKNCMLGFSKIRVKQPAFHHAMIRMVKSDEIWFDANRKRKQPETKNNQGRISKKPRRETTKVKSETERNEKEDTNHAQIIYRFLNSLGIRPELNTRYVSTDQEQKADDFMWSMEWVFDPERWKERRSSNDSPLHKKYRGIQTDDGGQGAAEEEPAADGAAAKDENAKEQEAAFSCIDNGVDGAQSMLNAKCQTDELRKKESIDNVVRDCEIFREISYQEPRPVSLSRSSSFDRRDGSKRARCSSLEPRTPSPLPVHSPWTAESIFREASVFPTAWD